MELELSADDNPTKPLSLRAARTDLGRPTASGRGILESVRRCIRTRESAL
jgi:hypothetical protein